MLVDAVRGFFAERNLGPARIVVAVSGGTDSTALLLALGELLEHDAIAAHVNHHLRGAESDADEKFVRELCAKLRIPLHVMDGALPADAVKQRGIEAAARDVRSAALHAVRERTRATWIATAHQRDDQAETVLMRILTGSGIAGLRGIHPIRDDGVIRPLLGVTRADVAAFLREREIVPRIDRSNDDPRFLRNRVRAILRELPDAMRANLAAIAEQAWEEWRAIERVVDALSTVERDARSSRFVRMPDDPWLRQALLHREIRRLDGGAREVSSKELARLAKELPSRARVTKSLELIRQRNGLVLRTIEPPTRPFEVPLTPETPARIEEIGATVHVRRAEGESERQCIELPKGAAPTFQVRNRRRGDRFQPLGMSEEKKLKDLLIDRKIDRELRDRIPLILWNGAIAWIAGVAVSERFKVTGAGERYEVWVERDDHEDVRR